MASINPKLKDRPDSSELVSFVPMAAVDSVSGQVVESDERKFGDVQKGYTVFADGDILLAKITPCFENGKIAQALLRMYGGWTPTGPVGAPDSLPTSAAEEAADVGGERFSPLQRIRPQRRVEPGQRNR